MNASQVAMTKPTVHVLCSPDTPTDALKQLHYGLEEEGIPCETWTEADGDALSLAWKGSQTSKLEQKRPLFRIPIRSVEKVRILGSNAARLVKKLPLKPLEGR